MGNGAFPESAIQRLAAIGKWMHVNGGLFIMPNHEKLSGKQ